MGKSFYKNITCGPLKIAAKIERTRYTDITLTTLLLLQFNTIIVISFLVISLFSIIIIIMIIIIVKNLHGHRHKYHQQLQLKHDKIVIIRQASSLYYFCLYRCWINGSQWIYQGPVLAILLVSTNDFTWHPRSPYPSLRVKFVL